MATKKEFILPPSQTPGDGVSSASVPDHELVRLIGGGSYGEVWLARNTLGTYRAIKIVYAKTFRHKRPFDREFKGVQKFEPVSRLHEGLMNVLQVGRNDSAGYFYCVMELADDTISGQVIDPEHYSPRTLAHDISKYKRLPIEECRRIGIRIGSAMEFLHRQGLIHRDIKPSNIVFVNGVPKLADIGLVVEVSEAASYVGTEGFIPPEGPGTAQADIYSFGKVLYEISTGKDRQDFPELPTYLGDARREKELFDLNKVILKACRADHGQRYKSAGAMVDHLQDIGTSRGNSFRKTAGRLLGIGGVGVMVVLIAVLGRILLLAGDDETAGKQSTTSQVALPEAKAVAAPEGMIAWWKGDGNTQDSFGTNHGILVNGTAFAVGKVGQAFSFDGVDDYVKIPRTPDLDLSQLTIEFWMKANNLTALQGLVTHDFYEVSISHGFGPRKIGVSFAISTDGGADISPDSFPDTATENQGGAPVSVGHWHHVAATYDRTQLQLYIDGKAWGNPVYHPGVISAALPESFMTFGAEDGRMRTRNFRGPRHFSGLLDEITIYNRALSVSEIQSIYDAGNAGKTITHNANTTR